GVTDAAKNSTPTRSPVTDGGETSRLITLRICDRLADATNASVTRIRRSVDRYTIAHKSNRLGARPVVHASQRLGIYEPCKFAVGAPMSDLMLVAALLAVTIVMFAANRPRMDAVALIMLTILPFTGVIT